MRVSQSDGSLIQAKQPRRTSAIAMGPDDLAKSPTKSGKEQKRELIHEFANWWMGEQQAEKAEKPAVVKPPPQQRRALEAILDDAVPDLAAKTPGKRRARRGFIASEERNDSTISIDILRAHLRDMNNLNRIVDLFQKFDADSSGLVNMEEFTNAVMEIVEEVDPDDVADLFCEIDHDQSGEISYLEMKDAFRAAAEREARKNAAPPPLPSTLAPRAKDVTMLYHQFKKNELAGPNKGAATLRFPNFEECLRVYYPKDKKENIVIFAEWVEATLEYKRAAMEDKIRERDEALVNAIDADGDNRISLGEFMELHKSTGLSKAQMRQRFRDKDFGNSGNLTMQQMKDRGQLHLLYNHPNPH